MALVWPFEVLRPLFHANTPPKWWTRYLFHVFTSKSDFWPFYWFWIFWLRFQLFLHCKWDQNFKWPYLSRLWVYNAEIFLWAPITQWHHICRRQNVTQKKSFCGTPYCVFQRHRNPKWAVHRNGKSKNKDGTGGGTGDKPEVSQKLWPTLLSDPSPFHLLKPFCQIAPKVKEEGADPRESRKDWIFSSHLFFWSKCPFSTFLIYDQPC